ncbi:hypothetical protein E4U58_006418, partial [Claviceps cyperi]
GQGVTHDRPGLRLIDPKLLSLLESHEETTFLKFIYQSLELYPVWGLDHDLSFFRRAQSHDVHNIKFDNIMSFAWRRSLI